MQIPVKKIDIFRNILAYSTFNIYAALISFATVFYLTRKITPIEMDIIAYFQTGISICTTIVGFNVISSIVIKYPKMSPLEFRKFTSTCYITYIISVIILISLVEVAQIFLNTYKSVNYNILHYSLLFCIIYFNINFQLAVWQVHNRLIRYGILVLIFHSISYVLTIYFIESFQKAATSRIDAVLISSFFLSIYCIYRLARDGFVKVSFSKNYFLQAINFSLPLIIHLLAPISIITFDRYMIANNGHPGELGTYFVAWQFSMPIMLLGDAINKAIKPWSSKKIHERDYQAVRNTTRKIIIMLCPICISAMAIVYFGYDLLVGFEYTDGKTIATILVLSAFIHISYYPLCNYLYFNNNTKYITTISISSSTLYVMCVIIFFPYYGTITLPILSVITNLLFVFGIASKNINIQGELIRKCKQEF